MADLDVDALAGQVLPLDGPHTPDAIMAAARLLAELVRRLNHATINPRLDPPDLDRVAGHLHAAVSRLPQLSTTLATELAAIRDRDGLYAVGPRDPRALVAEARSALALSGSHLAAAAEQLERACDRTAWLGIHEPDTEEPAP